MPTVSNTIRRRLPAGIVAAIKAIALSGSTEIPADNVVSRRFPQHQDLEGNSVVVSPASSRRLPSEAGLLRRQFTFVVSVHYPSAGDNVPSREEQDDAMETLQVPFSLPPQMPLALVAAVPELQEIRLADNPESFVRGAYRYAIDHHRFAVQCEVWQLAGVAQ